MTRNARPAATADDRDAAESDRADGGGLDGLVGPGGLRDGAGAGGRAAEDDRSPLARPAEAEVEDDRAAPRRARARSTGRSRSGGASGLGEVSVETS